MRLLATADIHGFEDVLGWIVREGRLREVDAMVVAGDLLGVRDDFPSVEDAMAASARNIKAILGEFGAPVFYVMGNDDLLDLEPGGTRCVAIHRRRVVLGDFAFVGYQCGPRFMGGPFERTEEELEHEIGNLSGLLDERTILVTHYPASGETASRFGLASLEELTRRCPYRVHVHGHVHDEFGVRGRHFNVASAGKRRAVEIDLSARRYRVVEPKRHTHWVSWQMEGRPGWR